MMRRNLCRWALAAVFLLPACEKQVPDELRSMDRETRALRRAVNTFAWNVMDTYYLWREEIEPALDAWENWEEPVQKVADIRYKDADGEDIDRWTVVTDRYEGMLGGVTGHTRTLGMDFLLYYVDQDRQRICAVVTYTSAGSPAEAAGLDRGDVILAVDGLEMTPDSYEDLVYDHLLGGGTVRLGLRDGRTLTVSAVDMYEDPVHTARILERPGGKKVGYLHYTSFTMDSCEDLVEIFRAFTKAGVEDLVLDLRYNGGGYVMAETVLASLLAPAPAVEAGSVFSQNIYNARLAETMKDKPTCFDTGFVFQNNGSLQVITTKGAKPDLKRLFVLVTGGSASASESLVCGLRPYMDVVLVGKRTYGKYCGGILVSAQEWYEEHRKAMGETLYSAGVPYVENWGMYVMISRYADCNGLTLSMPDGIAPDVEVSDDPLDGYPLGDPRETMLSAALSVMEGTLPETRSSLARPSSLLPVSRHYHPRTTGLYLLEM